MYGNTQMTILPLLPLLCIYENLEWLLRDGNEEQGDFTPGLEA